MKTVCLVLVHRRRVKEEVCCDCLIKLEPKIKNTIKIELLKDLLMPVSFLWMKTYMFYTPVLLDTFLQTFILSVLYKFQGVFLMDASLLFT